MQFVVQSSPPRTGTLERDTTLLVKMTWDDNFEFSTTYDVSYIDKGGVLHHIGSTKLGKKGLVGREAGQPLLPGHRYPDPPERFNDADAPLGEEFFSLGQDEDYFQTLMSLGDEVRVAILTGLKDCAYDVELYKANKDERVMYRSLTRYVSVETLLQRLCPLAHGNAALTPFLFTYRLPRPPVESHIDGDDVGHDAMLTIDVQPHSMPPSNVHVLIGRNGVGKTRALRFLISGVLASGDPKMAIDVERDGILEKKGNWSFSGLVFVTFSAFDDTSFLDSGFEASAVRLTKVSLPEMEAKAAPFEKRLDREREDEAPQSHSRALRTELLKAFVESMAICRRGLRPARWRDAIALLDRDDLFRESGAARLIELEEHEWEVKAKEVFGRLSSGHAIVLLTMTRLVEVVDERALVVLDEPESHLHPPLLSAFVRALADLMIRRNAVALVATHSPVVLQEVPSQCVSHLHRAGPYAVISSPTIETFGENVDTITREIFDLEVTRSGFYNLIDAQVSRPGATYESVVKAFGNQLGSEARAIIRARLHLRSSGASDEAH